jgi:hypothetical protein
MWKGKLAGIVVFVGVVEAFRLENTRGNFEAREVDVNAVPIEQATSTFTVRPQV